MADGTGPGGDVPTVVVLARGGFVRTDPGSFDATAIAVEEVVGIAGDRRPEADGPTTGLLRAVTPTVLLCTDGEVCHWDRGGEHWVDLGPLHLRALDDLARDRPVAPDHQPAIPDLVAIGLVEQVAGATP